MVRLMVAIDSAGVLGSAKNGEDPVYRIRGVAKGLKRCEGHHDVKKSGKYFDGRCEGESRWLPHNLVEIIRAIVTLSATTVEIRGDDLVMFSPLSSLTTFHVSNIEHLGLDN